MQDKDKYGNRQLTAGNNSYEMLNSILRHDISNYLTAINNYLELLEISNCNQKYMEKIRDTVDKSFELIGKVRLVKDYRECENGIKPINLSNTLLEELNGLSSNVNVRTNIPDKLYIHANEMLNSVFSNLLHNAVLHNDKEQKEIDLTIVPRKDQVEIRVADNGPGIPSDMKESIFKEGIKGKTGRTGLGLYIVKMLVESYGGEIWVEDNYPEGTVFVLTLKTVNHKIKSNIGQR